MAETITKRDFICKPAQVLEAIEARTGMKLAAGTLKGWRKANPLDLPCVWTEFDTWLASVLKARRDRRENARALRNK